MGGAITRGGKKRGKSEEQKEVGEEGIDLGLSPYNSHLLW